ncbi:MAG: TonB family protein [Gemmatimonadota bacterium]|nr:TonB family protein [Gemmatimonadota bacterium]
MEPSRARRYEKLAVLSLFLSIGAHLLLAFIPPSATEWFIGPPRKLPSRPRFEIVTIAEPPAPHYITPDEYKRSTPENRAIVPPQSPVPRFRASSADSSMLIALIHPELSTLPSAGRPGKTENKNNTATEMTVSSTRSDSSSSVQAYITGVLELIRNSRRYPAAARRLSQEGEVLLAFAIDSQGLLHGEVELLSPCRYGLLNRSARKCIKRSAPFPPLPVYVADDSLPLQIKLLYRLTD